MIPTSKFFSSQFDDSRITNLRLTNFAEDCLNRFKTLAIEGQFTNTIQEITVALDNLREDLGEVDSTINDQKLKTFKVTQFLKTFKTTMKAAEGIVMLRTGSKEADLYKILFPKGLSEYTKVTNTQMPILMHRVNDASTKYGTQLGQELADKLASLKTDWKSLKDNQEKKMTEVSDIRTERSIARKTLEMALTNALHTVSLEYPGNVDKCSDFFNFRLLLGKKSHQDENDTTTKKTVKEKNLKKEKKEEKEAQVQTEEQAEIEENTKPEVEQPVKETENDPVA